MTFSFAEAFFFLNRATTVTTSTIDRVGNWIYHSSILLYCSCLTTFLNMHHSPTFRKARSAIPYCKVYAFRFFKETNKFSSQHPYCIYHALSSTVLIMYTSHVTNRLLTTPPHTHVTTVVDNVEWLYTSFLYCSTL